MVSIYIWYLSRNRDSLIPLFPDNDTTKTLSYSVLLNLTYKVQLCTVVNFSASQNYEFKICNFCIMRCVKFIHRWCYISQWIWSIWDSIRNALMTKKVILDLVKKQLHFHIRHPLLQILQCFLYAVISILRHDKTIQ